MKINVQMWIITWCIFELSWGRAVDYLGVELWIIGWSCGLWDGAVDCGVGPGIMEQSCGLWGGLWGGAVDYGVELWIVMRWSVKVY